MKPRGIVILFVLLLVTTFLWSSTYSWHTDIHALQGQYVNRGIKVPDASKFCSTCNSTYFNSNEINSNDSNANFYWDATFWSEMDDLRAANGPGNMCLNSGYRTPDHDITQGGMQNSLHQYGNSADIRMVDGKLWSDMTQTERDDFKDTIDDSWYVKDDYPGDSHIHVGRGAYCDYAN